MATPTKTTEPTKPSKAAKPVRIRNVRELADWLGANEPTEESMSRRVYKGTDCGAWLALAYAPRFTLRFPWPRKWAGWPAPLVRVVEWLHILEPLDWLLFVGRKEVGRHLVGVQLGSIVEGSDYEAGPYTLRFPFTLAQFNATLATIEGECATAWDEANSWADDDHDEDL